MRREIKRAIAWGTYGAWTLCILLALVEHVRGRQDVARVWFVAGLPWLVVALWSDRR